MSEKPIRVMWLLNHSSARKFEIAILKSIGITEIFLPKNFPQDINFRSASVDYSEDKNLTITEEELDVLNQQDWYSRPSQEAWKIANRQFDICFFICHTMGFLQEVAQNFEGAAVWRTYGLDQSLSYTKLLSYFNFGNASIKKLGPRFWFGQAYEHLANQENAALNNRKIFLPLGMANTNLSNNWTGADPHILFICPDIGFNSYYQKVYEDFLRDFGDLPYKIGGAQPIKVNDPAVQGFVPQDVHERNMKESRVMFYHSQEPNHIHFHPFEAVKTGMPLLFMGGGMLDRMGGKDLPGRCATINEARSKVRRLLSGDQRLTEAIINSQKILLQAMDPDLLRPYWEFAIRRILDGLAEARDSSNRKPIERKRVAVILPEKYKGGTLRGAKLLAEALQIGSIQANAPTDVLFCHLESDIYTDEDFDDLPRLIQRRPFNWGKLSAAVARRAMRYAGDSEWEPEHDYYCVPDDGINYLCDCHLWIFVSDRFSLPLLRMRPTVLMVYDYLQRYETIISPGGDEVFLLEARNAKQVMVTTEFTRNDAINYAGVETSRVSKVPMLAPLKKGLSPIASEPHRSYFIWTTNAAPHKNQLNTLKALKIYYEELNGSLECVVTGVKSKAIKKGSLKWLSSCAALIKQSAQLQKKLKWRGHLIDNDYFSTLSDAAYLWHTAKVDNGTFSVIEAANLGVPSLSSDYPAMREIDKQFQLSIKWMDPHTPRQMAQRLKEMETEYEFLSRKLPSREQLSTQSVENLAPAYWKVISRCL